jgi:hypothetical protein
MALFQADPEKADLYKDFASRLYGVERDAVSKEQRQVGKISQLGLGFTAGPKTFQTVAKTMGGVELSEAEAESIVRMWRDTYAEIVQGWKICHGALNSIQEGTQQYIDPWNLCYTTAEGIKTPQGMIRYPHLRQEHNADTGRSEWVYGEGRHKARIYGGKIVENCLTGDSEVLTDSGWKPIISLSTDDLVWDGVEFVSHAGVKLMGAKEVIDFGGVRMTEDHKVLVDDKFVEARETTHGQATSAFEKSYRLP